MLEQILAIIRNTYFESIRQPIVLVLLVIATLMLIVANLTSTFTMDDDQKMLIDIGMATVFLFGALLSAFIASNVLTREIENKTVLTVVSKPVGRPLFVIGKYIGVAVAVIVASLYMCFVFALVERHGVLQTVRDPNHIPVIVFSLTALIVSVAVAVWCNYFYGKVFASTVISVATPLAGLAYLLSLLFKHDFSVVESLGKEFNLNVWKALIGVIMANLVLTSLAVAISTRLSQILTIICTLGVFLIGMLSDWLFGRLMYQGVRERAMLRAIGDGSVKMVDVYQTIPKTTGETIESTQQVAVIANEAFDRVTPAELTALKNGTTSLANIDLTPADFGVMWDHIGTGSDKFVYVIGSLGHSIFPNFQVLLLNDAVTQEHIIPTAYLGRVLLYGVFSIVAAMALAVILFQNREVG